MKAQARSLFQADFLYNVVEEYTIHTEGVLGYVERIFFCQFSSSLLSFLVLV